MNIENKSRKKVIDCAINPRIPKGLELIGHHGNLGKIGWDPSRVRLLKLDPLANSPYKRSISIKEEMKAAFVGNLGLIPGMWKSGTDLLSDVKNRAFRESRLSFPANVLDYLLENQEDIPSDWNDKHILFIGSLYKGYDGKDYSSLMARGLIRNPTHKIKELIQKKGRKKNLIFRAVLSTLYHIEYSWLNFGSSDFIECCLSFDDDLRYLTHQYVPVYSSKEE